MHADMHADIPHGRSARVTHRWTLSRAGLGALALAFLLLVGVSCASVEELIAEGDALKAQGRHAEAYAKYHNARHLDPHHPLVKARLGTYRNVPGGTNDPR